MFDPELVVAEDLPELTVWSRLRFVLEGINEALRLKPHDSVTTEPSLHQAIGGLLKVVHPDDWDDIDSSIPKWMLTEVERRTPLFWS